MMDANLSSIDPVSSPSAEQLALALAIVKLKPVGLDIKEYILQTRKHIRNSRNTDISCTPDKFFDSVAFWKHAYEKSEAEQSKLLDRIYELEQRNDALTTKAQTRDITQEITTQEKPKRKASMKASAKSPLVRKRAKTQILPAGNLLDLNTLGSQDDVLSDPGRFREAAGPFMRHFYALQKVLQKRPNNLGIVHAAVSLCTATEKEIHKALPEGTSNTGRGSRKGIVTQVELSHLALALRSVECATSLLVQALKKLSGTGNPEHDANLVIYHIVSLYRAVMNSMGQYCQISSRRTVTKSSKKTKASKQSKTTKSKQTKGSEAPDIKSKTEDQGAKQLSWLLNQ